MPINKFSFFNNKNNEKLDSPEDLKKRDASMRPPSPPIPPNKRDEDDDELPEANIDEDDNAEENESTNQDIENLKNAVNQLFFATCTLYETVKNNHEKTFEIISQLNIATEKIITSNQITKTPDEEKKKKKFWFF